MITAKSSFSFARVMPTYKNILRRERATISFLTGLAFAFFSLQYILQIVEYNRDAAMGFPTQFELYGAANVYNGFALFSFFLLELVAVLAVAVDLYGYMHNKRSTDVYHSLPLTRDELYVANGAAAMTAIAIPIVVNFLVVALCSLFVPGQNIGLILLEMVVWLAIAFSTFSIAAFCAVNAGTVFDTVIFSLGTAAALPLIYATILGLSANFIYGVPVEAEFNHIYKLSPVSVIVARQTVNMVAGNSWLRNQEFFHESNMLTLIWFAVGIVLFALGMLSYRRRKSELAEMVGTKGFLQMFLRTAGTLVGGAILAFIFCAAFEFTDSKFYFVIAMAFASLIIYFIGEVLLSRTVKTIPKALPTAVAVSAAVTVMSALIINGGMGIESYIPKPEDVASIKINSADNYLGYKYYGYTLESDEAVQLILAAHKAQLEGHANGEELTNRTFYSGSWLSFDYNLKDGKTASRRYHSLVPNTMDIIAQLETNDELIQKQANVYRATADMIDTVTVQNIIGTERIELRSLTAAQKSELLEAVKTDLLARDKNELLNGAMGTAYMEIAYKYQLVNGKDPFREESSYDSEAATPEQALVVRNGVTLSYDVKESYYYDTFSVVVTDSFKNTLDVLKRIGAGKALENDFSEVTKATASILYYNYAGTDGAIMQAGSDNLGFYDEEIKDYEGFYDTDNGLMVELTDADFAAVRGSLTNFFVNNGKTAYVAVRLHTGDKAFSLFYAPLEALPENAKREVCQRALDNEEYICDRDTLINSGYIYLD